MPQLPKPAMPHIIGSTTPCTSAHAIAASTALPPASRMSAPASVASGCAATIIAFFRYRIGASSMVARPNGLTGRRSDRAPEEHGARPSGAASDGELQILGVDLLAAEVRRAEWVQSVRSPV